MRSTKVLRQWFKFCFDAALFDLDIINDFLNDREHLMFADQDDLNYGVWTEDETGEKPFRSGLYINQQEKRKRDDLTQDEQDLFD